MTSVFPICGSFLSWPFSVSLFLKQQQLRSCWQGNLWVSKTTQWLKHLSLHWSVETSILKRKSVTHPDAADTCSSWSKSERDLQIKKQQWKQLMIWSWSISCKKILETLQRSSFFRLLTNYILFLCRARLSPFLSLSRINLSCEAFLIECLLFFFLLPRRGLVSFWLTLNVE